METTVKKPLISVIMSVFNGEKYLRDSINSILNQTYRDLEFIIINDGSTDGSIEVIQEIEERDNRIVLIDRENKGLIASLNECIHLAKGEYLVRMDADDISMPNRIEEQLQFMVENPDVSVLGSYVEIFGYEVKSSIWKLPIKDQALKARLLFTVAFCHPSVMYKKEIFNEAGFYYNKDYLNAEDYELWTRLAEKYKFSVVPKVLLKYRYVISSISRVADTSDVNERQRVLASIYNVYLSRLAITTSSNEERLHFNLTTSERISNSTLDLFDVISYFTKILEQNKKKRVFCPVALEHLLARKVLTVFVYQIKKGKFSVMMAIFHKLFFKAIIDVFKNRIV